MGVVDEGEGDDTLPCKLVVILMLQQFLSTPLLLYEFITKYIYIYIYIYISHTTRIGEGGRYRGDSDTAVGNVRINDQRRAKLLSGSRRFDSVSGVCMCVCLYVFVLCVRVIV